MLDRKLMQDDNRGLGQGVKDSVLTFEPFKLIVERRLNDVKVFPTVLGLFSFFLFRKFNFKVHILLLGSIILSISNLIKKCLVSFNPICFPAVSLTH